MTTTSQDVMSFVQTTLGLKEIGLETRMGKVRGWDSLRHLKLMTSLERQYGIKIPVQNIGKLTDVTSILDFVKSMGVIHE